MGRGQQTTVWCGAPGRSERPGSDWVSAANSDQLNPCQGLFAEHEDRAGRQLTDWHGTHWILDTGQRGIKRFLPGPTQAV